MVAVWRRAWGPLLLCECAVSILQTALLGPFSLVLWQRLIELSGSEALGNREIVQFLSSFKGMLAFVLGGSVTLGLWWLEYSLLLLVASQAIRRQTVSPRRLARQWTAAAPRLFGLALVHVVGAIVLSAPFLALLALTYRGLLGATDINFYLSERPPRFWLAGGIGAVLLVGLSLVLASAFIRWSLVVPAVSLDGLGSRASLALSARLMKGRARRFVAILAAWIAIRYLLLLALLLGLERANRFLIARLPEELSAALWSIAGLLLLDGLLIEIAGAFFSITGSILLASYYHAARAVEDGVLVVGDKESFAPKRSRQWLRAALILSIASPVGAHLAYVYREARDLVGDRPVRVTAHRAGSKLGPENSVASLRASIAAGADEAEIDVQLTADGHVVVLHDRDLRRVTGDRRMVHEVTLPDIRALTLLDHGRTTKEGIPTLGELIDACGDRLRLNIELKDFGHSSGLSAAVVSVLHEKGFVDRSAVSSFERTLLQQAKGADRSIPTGLILSAIQGQATRWPVEFLSVNHRLARGGLIREAHRKGMEVHAWTVNEKQVALRLMDLGCDALITSDPVAMRRIVDDYQSRADIERLLRRFLLSMRE